MKVIRGRDLPFEAASHEDPGNPGVLKRVLLQHADLQAGRVQMVNWSRLPAGNRFARHYHEDMQEIFVIVAGAVQMTVGAETFPMGRGDAAVVDPREIHEMENSGSEDVDYLVFGITSGEGGQTVVVEE